MKIERYKIKAECSCKECQDNYAQHVIPTMVSSNDGRWVKFDDYDAIFKVLESYENFIEFNDLWDRFQEYCDMDN